MARAILANILSDQELDQIFRDSAVQQRQGELLFSSVVSLLHLAVLKSKPSLHAAYVSRKEQLDVSVKSVYDKLAGTEMSVIRQLVRQTASKIAAVQDALQPPQQFILPGYEVRILDGSHLRATERRLDVQRQLNGAPLPGQALVVLNPQRMLVEDVFPCECGHTQERLILHQLIEVLEPGIVWITDRNFCTSVWLQEVNLNQSWFITRRHASFSYRSAGELELIGTTSTATVYEQSVLHVDSQGTELTLRRIVLKLNAPTSDGDTEIEVLTNLPASVSAISIADAYQMRWTIEGVFSELTLSLRGEIDTLAYPPAALLAYALALVSYNVLSLIKRVIEVVQGPEVSSEMSMYYMAEEIASTLPGMEIAISSHDWSQRYGSMPPPTLAEELSHMAKRIELRRYRKHRRAAKKPQPKRTGSYQHVSTQKLINNQKR